MTRPLSDERSEEAEGPEYYLKADPGHKWEKMPFPTSFLEDKPCQGRGGCRGVRAPSPLGSPSVPFPGPTLYHKPCFPHSTACTVLSKAKIVPGILWAGVDNPQLSAG